MKKTISAEHFCQTLAMNVKNERMSHADFRYFVENTLDIVEFERTERMKEHGVPGMTIFG